MQQPNLETFLNTTRLDPRFNVSSRWVYLLLLRRDKRLGTSVDGWRAQWLT